MVAVALQAAERLARRGIEVGVINARFLKPLDRELLKQLAGRQRLLVTMEENTLSGGFGALVSGTLTDMGWPATARQQLMRIGLPDGFVEHGERQALLEMVGLTADRVAGQLLRALRRKGARAAGTALAHPLHTG
jgi:1-deoxy-D-xylulose-5-phosphate synthase